MMDNLLLTDAEIDRCQDGIDLSDILACEYAIAKAQLDKAETLIRQDERERVRIIALKAIADEPELPGDIPDELWQLLNNRKDRTDIALKEAVLLTKKGITDRFLEALKQ